MDNLPKIDFPTFLLSVASAAFMGMGAKLTETDEPREVNLGLARQNIDLLELIELKTRGNRTAEEDQLIQHLLFETRMRFVEMQKA